MTREKGVGLKYIGVTIMNKDKYEILSRLRLEIRDMKREDLESISYMSGYTAEEIIDHAYGNVMDLIDYIINDEKEWVEPNEINDGWISVEDEMPKLGQRVMAFCRAGILTFLRYDGEVWFEMSSRNEYLLSFVTHWRPLPEPPKGE